MAKKGPAYPVDAAWKDEVRREMRTQGIDQKELARRARCTQSTISDLLGPGSFHSSLVPMIHKALRWPPPAPPSASKDVQELLYLFPQLDDDVKRNILDQVRIHTKRKPLS